MAQAGATNTTPFGVPDTPEMALIFALLITLEDKAVQKKRLRPSHAISEILRVWAGDPVVVDLRRRRANVYSAQVEESARSALEVVKRLERVR